MVVWKREQHGQACQHGNRSIHLFTNIASILYTIAHFALCMFIILLFFCILLQNMHGQAFYCMQCHYVYTS